jgi:hypothetical protein
MVKKLECIEMAQLATIPASCGDGKGKQEKEGNTLSGATGWPAEILLAGGSINVQGRQVLRLYSYIKDAWSVRGDDPLSAIELSHVRNVRDNFGTFRKREFR